MKVSELYDRLPPEMHGNVAVSPDAVTIKPPKPGATLKYIRTGDELAAVNLTTLATALGAPLREPKAATPE